jgi:menaquinone-9 beta-reductase
MNLFTAQASQLSRDEHLEALKDSEWDLVILGAGVAGAAAAILAARSGFRTLLVDAKSFPREKVCGGCLNRRAQASLERLGVLQQLHQAGAVPITSLHLKIDKTSVVWNIPTLLSVRRSTLDSELVRSAIDSGASFLDGVSGLIVPRTDEQASKERFRQVALQNMSDSKGRRMKVHASCVLVADGLTRSSLRLESGWTSTVQPSSRIGVQRMVSISQFSSVNSQVALPANQLQMIVSKEGYVGISHTDGNLVDVAGAIDPKSIAKRGGVAETVCRIIEGGSDSSLFVSKKSNGKLASLPEDVSEGNSEDWLATPALTRSSTRVASDRVFLLGDSIGYIEPFTGEGMSWALASAEAVMPLVSKSIGSTWHDGLSHEWTSWVDSQRRQKQKTCWWISRQLRRLSVAAWTLRLCNSIYPIRAAIIKKVTS